MSAANDSQAPGYDAAYTEFDSPLMRRLRAEAYGEDIGQHSWVTAEELRGDSARLHLSPASRLVDLGCGPCGPLTFLVASAGCSGTGLEQSPAALQAGRARAATLGVEHRLTLEPADLNEPLALVNDAFDAALSLDIVLHLKDRAALFREVARILVPGGRFLFTDAGVLTGAISADEVARRSVHGHTQFSAPGFNERMLEHAGLRLLESEDRTASALGNARGRLDARLALRQELETLEGPNEFARQQQYLEAVIALSERGAVSRMMYLAERPGSDARA